MILFSPPSLPSFPSPADSYLDIRLNYPFLCLDVDNILKVISAMLTEQTLIFTSSLYPMLTYVIEVCVCVLHNYYTYYIIAILIEGSRGMFFL